MAEEIGRSQRRRRIVAAGLGALLLLGAVVLLARSGQSESAAARALGPLPSGFRYGTLEPDDAAATAALFRERHHATDVAVGLVGTPQDLAPLGVKVVAFTLATTPDLDRLAAALARDVPLSAPERRSLRGQTVLAHDSDETFASSALWARGRLVIVAFGATRAEVEAVLGALIDQNR